MKQIAMNIYRYLLRGDRVDMIFNDSGIYVLEMNTSPGLTQLSDIPAQAKAAGISLMNWYWLFTKCRHLNIIGLCIGIWD